MTFFIVVNIHNIYHFNHLQLYNSVALSAFVMLYDHYHYLVLKVVYHPKQKPCSHQAVSLHSLWQPLIGTVSMDLPIVDIAYEWNIKICGFMSRLFYFVFKGNPCNSNSFPFMTDIGLQGYITFCLFFHQLLDICFYLLLILNQSCCEYSCTNIC